MAKTALIGISASEAVQYLDALTADGDTESDHCDADDILVELLKSIGYAQVAEAYERARERVGFWYA